MKSKLLLHQLVRVVLLSSLHLLLTVLAFLYAEVLSLVAASLIIINMIYLIRYFSRTAQYFIAKHAAKKHKSDSYIWWNALLGILLTSALFYGFFVMLFVHLVSIYESI